LDICQPGVQLGKDEERSYHLLQRTETDRKAALQ
jgi:hypothetical protein